MEKCQEKTEVWARCCGYFSPIKRFNRGKRAEYKDRKTYMQPIPIIKGQIICGRTKIQAGRS